MMNSVIHPVTGKNMQYKYLMKDPIFGPLFEIGLSNELGRVCQGIRDVAGTNTAFFIDLHNIPKDRKITYGKLVCDFKPNKTEKHWVGLTVGGDILDYSGDTATSTADIATFKILINSTLSTNEAKMMMMDIKNYYLGTPLPTYDYMKLPLTILPLQRLGVPGDPQGDVRFEAGRPPGKSIITKTVEFFCLLPYKTHARPMVAQHKTNSFHIGSG
jgi:hypothetical protein